MLTKCTQDGHLKMHLVSISQILTCSPDLANQDFLDLGDKLRDKPLDVGLLCQLFVDTKI